jgi:hypothetical protein
VIDVLGKLVKGYDVFLHSVLGIDNYSRMTVSNFKKKGRYLSCSFSKYLILLKQLEVILLVDVILH